MKVGRVSLVLAWALLFSTLLSAGADPNWEIEVHGGAIGFNNSTAGTVALPLPGAAIPVPQGLPLPAGGRVTSSWYFGDGALQLSQALASRFGSPVVPLDSVLESRFAARRTGGVFGVSVRRSLGPRLAAEFGLDQTLGKLELTSDSIRGIEASRLTFISAFTSLVTSPLGSAAQTVTSDATITDHRGRQVVVTGALLVNLREAAKVIPYAAIGGGYISNNGGAPSVHLVGHYHFVYPPIPVPQNVVIDQTDDVRVRVAVENRPALIVGTGMKYAATERWGIRIDLRDFISRDRQRTELDASPATAPSTTGLILGTTPPLYFGYFGPRSTISSTLSGEPIGAFKTFQSTGVLNQVHLSAGVFWRF